VNSQSTEIQQFPYQTWCHSAVYINTKISPRNYCTVYTYCVRSKYNPSTHSCQACLWRTFATVSHTWCKTDSMRLCSLIHSVCNTANTLCSFARLSPGDIHTPYPRERVYRFLYVTSTNLCMIL